MLHVAWGKSGNETKLEKVRFTFLTADSLSWSLIYDRFEKKELSNKRSSIIQISIQSLLLSIKYLLPSSGTNNDSKESSIYCNIRSNIRSNNSILVKLITSSPDLAKNRMSLKNLAYLLYLPTSAQDKELIQKFMKEYYSLGFVCICIESLLAGLELIILSCSSTHQLKKDCIETK